MGDAQSKTLQEELEAGDLVEIFQGLYRHFGGDVGGQDRKVAHLTVPGGALGVSASGVPSSPGHNQNGLAKEEPLSGVAGGETYRVNRTYGQKCQPRPAEEMVPDADGAVWEPMDYNLLRDNWEHFATGVRLGVRQCNQVDADAIGNAAIAGVIGVAGVATAAYYIHKALNGRPEEEHQRRAG